MRASITPMISTRAKILALALAFPALAPAQPVGRETPPAFPTPISTADMTPTAGMKLPDRLPVEWVLRYEQVYGLAGLYVDEPPAEVSDAAAGVRKDLIDLTRAARSFRAQVGDRVPTPDSLRKTNFLDRDIAPPPAGEYVFKPEANRFVCTAGAPYDIVFGAFRQLEAAEDYRRRVASGSLKVTTAWADLAARPGLPEPIKREIETRQFVLAKTDTPALRDAAKTQALLQELDRAIKMAVISGLLQQGQKITMEDVGATGLIRHLEALPRGGKYHVTKVGVPPAAIVNGFGVKYDPNAMIAYLKNAAEKAAREQPDYPPALALLARYQTGAEALTTINRAVALWPDVPALRIQRLAINSQLLRVNDLSQDIDYIVARFPSAPHLLEVDLATRKSLLNHDQNFRAGLARAMADVRPELLNIQILAIKELSDAGKPDLAKIVRNRLVERHPGYDPLIPVPGENTGKATKAGTAS